MSDLPKEIFDPVRLAAVRATGLLDTPAEENFDRLAGLASTLLRAPYAFVTVVDETRSFWKSCIGVVSQNVDDRQNRVEESFCQYVIGSGEPLIIGDAAADPRTADNPSIESMGVAAWAGYPLFGPKGEVLGTFCVVDTVVREWTDQDVTVLATLAAAASAEIALRDAAVTAMNATIAAQNIQARLAFLADASDMLATTAHAEVAVGLLAQKVVAVLCDWCLITVVDEVTGKTRDIGRAHRDPAFQQDVERYADLHLVDSSAPSAVVIRTGQPMVVDIDEELITRSLHDPRGREAIAALKPASAAVFPLRGRGEPFGTMSLVNGYERGALTADELSAARELARRAGLSLENARLHGQQRRIADVLQDSLLTRPPDIPGLQIAVRYRPATEDAQVGGDWYDVFLQADGTTVLVIGDVVGHDVRAVSVMGQIRTMVRSIGYDRAASPAELLGRVDRALAGLDVETLCTAQVFTLPAQSALSQDEGTKVTWSSAGHPGPLIVHPDGRVQDLDDQPDRLLGVRGESERHDHETTLVTGATLVLMTDGLFERRAERYDDSLARLRAELSTLSQLGVDEMCERLLETFAPTRADDDIALIAVRVPPAG
jgi:serine phosphatase RsbU (regulator of sigma subunit)